MTALLLLGLPFPVMVPGLQQPPGTMRDVVLVQRGRSSRSKLRAIPAGWSIPGRRQTRARPGLSSGKAAHFPFSAWPATWQQRQYFTPVSTFGRKGGKIVISVKPWECGCPENKQKLCFFSERPL